MQSVFTVMMKQNKQEEEFNTKCLWAFILKVDGGPVTWPDWMPQCRGSEGLRGPGAVGGGGGQYSAELIRHAELQSWSCSLNEPPLSCNWRWFCGSHKGSGAPSPPTPSSPLLLSDPPPV